MRLMTHHLSIINELKKNDFFSKSIKSKTKNVFYCYLHGSNVKKIYYPIKYGHFRFNKSAYKLKVPLLIAMLTNISIND